MADTPRAAVPDRLPIYELEAALVRDLPRLGRAVLKAPTGSGKSTQVPQMILDRGLAGPGAVVVLEPRRLAARLLAKRVAAERSVRLGGEVGFSIRFDDCSSPETRIRFVTEGILLRMMLADPSLPGVGAVVFDEFHERHIFSDATLARAAQIQRFGRPDLKIAVMSATLDSAALEAYLAPCAVLAAAGRAHPVAVEHLRQPLGRTPVWEAAADGVERLLAGSPDGDVLVFMPGAYEISRTMEALRARPAARSLEILPLHGDLPPDRQDAALARYDRRKVVVATNVAETSLTIEGIRLVVDGGLARVARYDPFRGINMLLVEPISRSSAEQRAGRAGRTAPGRCLRLWTEAEHAARPERDDPEIRRADPADVILTLAATGVRDVRAFPWLDPPEERALDRAEELLRTLGAFDGDTGELTPAGRTLAAFPVHPRYARMLLTAGRRGCVPSAALIAALTQEPGLLLADREGEFARVRDDVLGGDRTSDFFALMSAWRYARDRRYDAAACRAAGINAAAARRVERLRDRFLRIARGQGLPAERDAAASEPLRMCVLAGFSDRLARRSAGDRCRLVYRREGVLAKESVVRSGDLFVASEIHEIEGRPGSLTVRLSLATAVERSWLEDLFPDAVRRRRSASYDPAQKRVTAAEEVFFLDLSLGARRDVPPAREEAARILAGEVLAGRVELAKWDRQAEQWILRLNALAAWCPELGLPAIGPEERRAILEKVCLGAFTARDVRDRPVAPALAAWLSPAARALLDRHAPERIALSNGRQARVTYVAGGPPHVALKIQELYGVKTGAAVAMGRVPVAFQILAPNNRPVQITQDIAGFWRTGYPAVKRELQRRYPKHRWL